MRVIRALYYFVVILPKGKIVDIFYLIDNFIYLFINNLIQLIWASIKIRPSSY